MKRPILVVDDDAVARNLLQEVLHREGLEVTTASSGEEAIALTSERFFPLVLSDIRMLDIDGLDVLKFFRKHHPRTVVILMTAFGSMSTAIEAIKEGAFDYISKPFKIEDLKVIVRKALREIDELNRPVGEELPRPNPMGMMVGSSPRMLEIYKTVARASMSEAPVLIIGESGTGKELIARAIHSNSSRRRAKFVAVNCGALPDALLESELFGHVRGAFTGAGENRKGLFEEADRGTLFLDEIGDISPAMQVKLLRALQDGEIRPVGSNEVRKVEPRMIAATHRNLIKLVSEGKFREDLYYRLKVINIDIPPLRERIEDLPELVTEFLVKFARKNNKPVSHVTIEALSQLKRYGWPGNVRELQNVIERAVALTRTAKIDLDDLPSELHVPQNLGVTVEEPTRLDDVEKQHILHALQQTQYNKTRAAEKLGIDRGTLYRKAQKYQIDMREK